MAYSWPEPPVSVLFVCLGNICRSPMAEAIFRHLTVNNTCISDVDSAGTGAYHAGAPPDSRAMATLAENGITNYRHAARVLRPDDLERFDYVLVMDATNLQDVQRHRHRLLEHGVNERALARVMLYGDFGGTGGPEEVIDPYSGGREGFDMAYHQLLRFTRGFLAETLGGGQRVWGEVIMQTEY
ncbi:MAG: hypothetical protein M1832_004768 [Thelocarpon impressellum]|nr:MAG: hypothetical protein M1832_004768 [Thelocarpon impressellum]